MVTVASLLQIMDYVGSLDSSRDLQPIHAKNFINKFHLVLHACVKIFDVTFFTEFTGKDLNMASVCFQVSERSLFLPYLIQSNPHFLFLIQSLRKGKKLEQRTP